MPKPDEFRIVVSPDRKAGWCARQALRQHFSDLVPEKTLIDLSAVVTELVNNAVVHGPGRPVTVIVVTGDETIRGEVADQGNPSAAIPKIQQAGHGGAHGLEVVDKLTSSWAVHEGSTHVWFELPLEG